MCLPWNHKWETLDHCQTAVWDVDSYGNQIGDRPSSIYQVITQRCNIDLGGCGKEIVRKYRV